MVDGGTGGPPAAGEGEVMSDISVLLEMLPKLGHLYVYEAPTSGLAEIDLYNAFVTDDKAAVISSSWGNCEELESQGDNILFGALAEEAVAQGQQIFQAAGDSGAGRLPRHRPRPPAAASRRCRRRRRPGSPAWAAPISL